MGKKYRLTEETKEYNGIILHRIQAARDFRDVKAGDLGGWIESEENLSHDGNCWVYKNAKAYQNAWICGDAWVGGNTFIYGNAKVCGNAKIYGNAQVYENSLIYDNAQVCEDASVYGHTKICENSYIGNNAKIYGYAEVYGNAQILENAQVKENTDFICICPIGVKEDSITFYKTDTGIYVTHDCFNGSIEVFKQEVKEIYGDDKYAKQYELAMELAKNTIN